MHEKVEAQGGVSDPAYRVERETPAEILKRSAASAQSKDQLWL
jgi:hypothetical protein